MIARQKPHGLALFRGSVCFGHVTRLFNAISHKDASNYALVLVNGAGLFFSFTVTLDVVIVPT